MLKKNILVLISLLTLISLFGCTTNKSNDALITNVEKLETTGFADYQWLPIDEESAIKKSDIIFKGKMTDNQEICTKFKQDDTEHEAYFTLLSFKIDKIFCSKDKDLNQESSIKVILPLSSREWDQNCVNLENDKDYIIFAQALVEDEKDYMKSYKIAPYAIKYPIDSIISITSNGYEFSDIFQNLKKESKSKAQIIGATDENINDFFDKSNLLDTSKGIVVGEKFNNAQTFYSKLKSTFVRQDDKFEDDLSSLINKYN